MFVNMIMIADLYSYYSDLLSDDNRICNLSILVIILVKCIFLNGVLTKQCVYGDTEFI